jgi:hypothetical protein
MLRGRQFFSRSINPLIYLQLTCTLLVEHALYSQNFPQDVAYAIFEIYLLKRN